MEELAKRTCTEHTMLSSMDLEELTMLHGVIAVLLKVLLTTVITTGEIGANTVLHVTSHLVLMEVFVSKKATLISLVIALIQSLHTQLMFHSLVTDVKCQEQPLAILTLV
jgi:hypothetical protein